MSYTIETKNEITGIVLVIKIPEKEIDLKALNTIQADPPPFTIPFKYRSVDDLMVLTYQPGTYNEIKYFHGNKSPAEYINLWKSLFNPFIECDDWFMNAFSFITNPENIYWDKDSGTVKYIYVPSLIPCSDSNSLKLLAEFFSQNNQTSDNSLENKVLRNLHNFNPYEFVKMFSEDNIEKNVSLYQHNSAPQPIPVPPPLPISEPVPPPPLPTPVPKSPPKLVSTPKPGPGEIVIPIPSGAGGKGSNKKEKEKKNVGLFGKFMKKESSAAPVISEQASQPSFIPSSPPPMVIAGDNDDPYDATVLINSDKPKGARFVIDTSGGKMFPQFIDLSDKAVFSIGRVDSSAGRQVNDFEFAKNMPNISRKHAVVETKPDGKYIIDLSSAAGTWVNGQRISPNVPYLLTQGTKISFGNAGADYTYEGN